jgi:hypothetical protein
METEIDDIKTEITRIKKDITFLKCQSWVSLSFIGAILLVLVLIVSVYD